MIDFHTHILPGIDDGAKDVSVSAAMLETEKEQGVNEIVLTPHYYGKFYSPTDFVRRRAAASRRGSRGGQHLCKFPAASQCIVHTRSSLKTGR